MPELAIGVVQTLHLDEPRPGMEARELRKDRVGCIVRRHDRYRRAIEWVRRTAQRATTGVLLLWHLRHFRRLHPVAVRRLEIVSCRSQGTQFYLASQSDVQRTELLTVSSRSKSSRTTGAVWLCLRIRRPANTNRHGGPHPPHRIHPRNSLRRLLGLYIGSSPRRHRLHGSCAASPYRHHLLQRPCRPADVPPAQPHGEQDGSR